MVIGLRRILCGLLVIGLDFGGSVLYNSLTVRDARTRAIHLFGPTTKGVIMGRRRSSVIRRVRVDDPRSKTNDLSDGQEVAKFLLQNGYRSAIQTANQQCRSASDKKVRQWWNNTRVWVNILSDKGGSK